jgi:transcriptional regulator with XRE-family HTH domain
MTRTPKGRALGKALREARQGQELTVRALAAQINRDPAVLSRWETGERTPKPENVARILTTLGVTGERYEEIIELAYGADDSSWVATSLPAQQQQLAALLDFEQSATSIVEVSPLLVPGLLQTSDYMRAVMIGARVQGGELARRVAVRIERREVLTRPEPARFTALVGQAALFQVIGSRDVLAAQLRFVLDMARRPNVEFRVIRYDSGWHPGLEGPFLLIESGQGTVVHLENRKSGLFLHEDADVEAYRSATEMVRNVAMSAAESVRFVAEVAGRLEKST